ncbi:MAG: magnesium/cobalt transporter CorA [Desulfobulbaceae bacterium]|nr:magnesium/cobalt transporter CorA [Desulfobulbaceae bacterium]
MKNQKRTKGAAAYSKSIGIFGRVVSREKKSAGTPPGTVVHTGERKTEQVVMRYFDYDEKTLHEGELATVEDSFQFLTTPTVTWIDVVGLHDVSHIEQIGKAFELHPLMIEDIASPRQRPKIEEYEDSLFVVLKMLAFDTDTKTIEIDQMSLVVGKNYILSFQEKPWDVLEPIRNRIRQARSRIRSKGPDYLAYTIIDAVVDGYFKILEEVGDEIEILEELVLSDVTALVMHRIHKLKREILVLRKAVWPLREVLGSLYRNETTQIEDQTRVYLRDVYDHSVQIIDTIETFRDLLTGTMDLYISSVNNRMNEVMKVLTVIATIFIPLSFFVGVYGMNFEYMPELKIHWAYPALMLFMTMVAGGMLWLFRHKHWF